MSEEPTQTSEEMACRELVELVTDYLEERLPAHDRARFEAHLDDCPYCVNYVDQLRETLRLTGELREESLDPEVRAALLVAFHGWQRA